MYTIFSVPLNVVSREELYTQLKNRLKKTMVTTIATVNPEILLLARRQSTYRQALSSFTFRCIDGIGIPAVVYLRYLKVLHRLTGGNLVSAIINYAIECHMRIGLLGGSKGVSLVAVQNLKNMYPNLDIIAISPQSPVVVEVNGNMIAGDLSVRSDINILKPDILLVALGAPKQELWIQQYISHFKSVKVAIGIGGLIDIYAHKLITPPKMLSNLGLEWIWRFAQQPFLRGKRIFRAIIVFPLLAITQIRKI